MKRNLNSSESARVNLPTIMVEWLFNSELPSLKCPIKGSSNCFHLSSITAVFMRFSSLIQMLPTSRCILRHNAQFCNVLFDVMSCYWKSLCKMAIALFRLECLSFIELWTKSFNQQNCRKTNEHKKKIKLLIYMIHVMTNTQYFPKLFNRVMTLVRFYFRIMFMLNLLWNNWWIWSNLVVTCTLIFFMPKHAQQQK